MTEYVVELPNEADKTCALEWFIKFLNIAKENAPFAKNKGLNMKTYECISHSGNTGKQIVLFVKAYSASSARADALIQARKQFGPGAGAVTIVNCKEV